MSLRLTKDHFGIERLRLVFPSPRIWAFRSEIVPILQKLKRKPAYLNLMSEKFFERMRDLLPQLLKQLDEEEKRELDKEVERVTGMDCDAVAETLSALEFQRLAHQVYLRIKRRKKREVRPETEVPVYA